jgi:uncharacterized protein (TIGR00369 family)
MSGDNHIHYQKLEHMYLSARCNEYYQPKIAVRNASAEITLPVHNKLFHAAGAVHGSAYFKALDDAAYFSANSIVPDVFVLTANFNLYLTRPVSQGILKAFGIVIYTGKNQIIAEAELFDYKSRLVAKGSGTYVRSNIHLSEDIGYK